MINNNEFWISLIVCGKEISDKDSEGYWFGDWVLCLELVLL